MRGKLSWQATWAMAVGGMIGGGIYTLAGVVLDFAGALAWVSLLVGGLVAMATASSYTALTLQGPDAAAPLDVLLREGRRRLAGLLAWTLLLVYVLALAVYTFTFGRYVGGALGVSPALPALAVVLALVGLNLLGIEQPAGLQIAAVWLDVAVLAGLAVAGLGHLSPQDLPPAPSSGSLAGVVAGAAATFIAFEGFELVAYDARDIARPRRTLRSALPVAVATVAVIYAVVTVGATALVGAPALIQHQEAALAFAARRGLGPVGFALVTVAAGASAASAINATLFSAARLLRTAAGRGLMPAGLIGTHRRRLPGRALVALGGLGALVAMLLSLQALVQVASLAFLALFALVNAVALGRRRRGRWISLGGALGTVVAGVVVLQQLGRQHPAALVAFALALVVAAAAYFATDRRQRGGGHRATVGRHSGARARATIAARWSRGSARLCFADGD